MDQILIDIFKTKLRTANEKTFYSSHHGKIALHIEKKAMHFTTLVAPTFGEDLIGVSQLTAKRKKVLSTQKGFLLLNSASSINDGIIIKTKEKDNLYFLQALLTKPKRHQVKETQFTYRKKTQKHFRK